jgi:hypothetical protein
VAALAGAVLLLAGCGSSGSGTLSRAQLITRANAACSSTNARIAAQPEPSSLEALAGYASDTRSATTQLQQSLSALKAPASDSAAFDRYVAALEQGDALLARISSAAGAEEGAAVSSLGKELAKIPTATLADAAGLSACAKASSAAG